MSALLLRHVLMLRLIPRAPRKIATADIEAALRDQGIDINAAASSTISSISPASCRSCATTR